MWNEITEVDPPNNWQGSTRVQDSRENRNLKVLIRKDKKWLDISNQIEVDYNPTHYWEE